MLIELLRPKQWYKNFLIFVPLIASHNLSELDSIVFTIYGFIILCLSSGGAYIINDIIDAKKDLLHPEKKHRPIPSGKISKKNAIIISIILLIFAEASSFYLDFQFFIINSFLIASMILYSIKIKNIFLIDVFSISINYVLRALAGAFLIDVRVSPWLIIGIFFLALLLAFGKRKTEIMFLDSNSFKYRNVLNEYSKEFLNYSIIIVASTIIVVYSIYAINGPIEIGDWRLAITIPVAFFILILYINSIFLGKYKIKELNDLLISDKKIMISILVYCILTISLIYLIPNNYFK
jgi:4-hydroxybenzoate polyprenyltransferase